LVKDFDPVNLSCHVAFQPPLTRKERADNVKKRFYFLKYGEHAREVLHPLLEKFADGSFENEHDLMQLNTLTISSPKWERPSNSSQPSAEETSTWKRFGNWSPCCIRPHDGPKGKTNIMEIMHESQLQEIAKLKAENRRLKKRLAFFENHPAFASGLHEQSVVAKLLGGDLTHPQSSDLDVGEVRLRIRFSTIKTPIVSSLGANRWSWPDVLDDFHEFDGLILMGVPDEDFRYRYLDPACSFVLFDIPFEDVETVSQINGPHWNVHLSTDPQKAQHAFTARLYSHFQIREEELESRYTF